MHEDAITNILSLSRVAAKHRATFDSGTDNIFKVHTPNGIIQFHQSASGLYYCNLKDINISLVNTVEENKEKYSAA